MQRTRKHLHAGEEMPISLHDVDSSCSESEHSRRRYRLPPSHIAELPGSTPPLPNERMQTLPPTCYKPPQRSPRFQGHPQDGNTTGQSQPVDAGPMFASLQPSFSAPGLAYAPPEVRQLTVPGVPTVRLVPPTPLPHRDMGTPPPPPKDYLLPEPGRSNLAPGPLRLLDGSRSMERSHRPSPSAFRNPLPAQPPATPSKRTSRARVLLRDSMSRLSTRIDSTPGDMIWPGPALVGGTSRTGGVSMASRTLGQVDRPKPPLPPPPRFDNTGADNSFFDIESLNECGPPDGGRYAWLVACCGFFVTFNSWGLNTAFGVFQAYYKIVLMPERSADDISWIGSLQLFLLFFLGTPIGLAMDRGWFRVFFNGGTAVLLAGLFATGSCTEFWHFVVVQGLVVGLGMGMLFCSGVIVLMSYFGRNVGKAMAIGAVGSSVGAIAHALVFQQLIERVSFAWTTRAMALVALTTLAAPNAIVRPCADAPRAARKVDLRAFADAAYLAMAAGFFFAFWGLYFAVYYMVLYSMTELRLPGTQAINLLIAMAGANLAGRLLPGVVSDACTGPLNLVIPSCVLSAMFTVVWIWSTSEAALFATAVFYGFASAGIQALYSPTLHSFSHAHPETMGQRSGLVFTIISFACLTGTPIGGRLIAAGDGSYLGAQLFSGLSMLVAAALLLLSRWLRVGWAGQRV